MTYILGFLPEIEDDVIAGYTWYEEKTHGLGEEFIRVFYARAGEIPRHPLLYPVIYNGFRRRILKRFPYAIYFRIEGNEIIVFGVFHCARNPGVIRAKLLGRNEGRRLG